MKDQAPFEWSRAMSVDKHAHMQPLAAINPYYYRALMPWLAILAGHAIAGVVRVADLGRAAIRHRARAM